VWEQTRTPLEQLNIEQAKLQALLDANAISFDTFARASLDLEESLRAGPAQAISELDQFTQRAAQNMQDYLGSSFQQIMEGNFDNIGDAFVSMLNNMVAQAAAAQLSKYLFGDLVGGTGGGAAGDLLSSAASAIFGGFRAEGGGVQRGKGYIVGERGPEWFEPATSGTVVPNHALGGTSNSYHITVAMPQGATRETAMQFGSQVARRLSMAQARNG
jgi:phage-related minor tail protein